MLANLCPLNISPTPNILDSCKKSILAPNAYDAHLWHAAITLNYSEGGSTSRWTTSRPLVYKTATRYTLVHTVMTHVLERIPIVKFFQITDLKSISSFFLKLNHLSIPSFFEKINLKSISSFLLKLNHLPISSFFEKVNHESISSFF